MITGKKSLQFSRPLCFEESVVNLATKGPRIHSDNPPSSARLFLFNKCHPCSGMKSTWKFTCRELWAGRGEARVKAGEILRLPLLQSGFNFSVLMKISFII